MTADEKEAILVELFKNKRNVEVKTKEVNKSLQELRILKSRVAKEIEDIKPKRREVFLYLLGKGRFAEIVMEPVRLKNKLLTLEKTANERFEGQYDQKAIKAYEGKGPVLREDIELAEAEAEKAEAEIADIINEYGALTNRKKGINMSIKTQSSMEKRLTRELKRINKNIKKTDKKKTN